MVKIGGSRELAVIVDAFRQQVINDVIQYRIDHHTNWSKSADEKDYPKVITGCEYADVREAGRSERGRCYTLRSTHLHPLVYQPIDAIAPLWKPIPYSYLSFDRDANTGLYFLVAKPADYNEFRGDVVEMMYKLPENEFPYDSVRSVRENFHGQINFVSVIERYERKYLNG